jgi:hypothetical protein
MTTAKVALSIDAEVLQLARKRVKAGRAKSLSALVTEAVDEKLRRDDLAELLDRWDEQHGPPGRSARAWAKRLLGPSS